MAGTRQIISRIIIFIIVLALAGGGYLLYHYLKNPVVSISQTIPTQVSLFVEFNDLPQLLDKLEADNPIWHTLKPMPELSEFNRNLKKIDSLLSLNPEAENIFRKNKFCISFHETDSNKIGNLFLAALTDPADRSRAVDFMIDFYGPFRQEKISLPKLQSYNLYSKDGNSPFFFTVNKGVFIGSQNRKLVEQAIDQQQKSKSVLSDPGFLKLQSTAGKKVDMNIYIQYDQLDVLRDLLAGNIGDRPMFLPFLASWSELDVIIKPDEWLINGYTYVNDSLSQFLNVLSGQKPQKIGLTRILPFNVNSMFWIGLEDASVFQENYRNFIESHQQSESIQQTTEMCNSDVSWVGSEIAVVAARELHNTDNIHHYAVIGLNNTQNAENILGAIREPSYTHNYNEHLIFRISDNNFLHKCFGPAFKVITSNYYFFIDDYVVFGNSAESLILLLETYKSGKTLDVNENYTAFADNVSDNSNLYFYYNFRNSIDRDKSLFNRQIKEMISQHPEELKNFQAFAFQFTNTKNLLYTNVYLRYNQDYKEEDLSVWKTRLDAEAAGQPYLVKDHRTGKLKIIVFDVQDNMYLIDHYGNIIWKLPISGPPMSDVYPVDYYKNGKVQYLFNTSEFLYLIDLMGREVDNYPIKLNKKASSGLAVLDYNNNRDYRLLIPSEDKMTYNYDIKGNRIRGWVNPKSKELINIPPVHLVANKKDYIIFTDEDGNVMITDRKGKKRISIKTPFIKGKNSGYYINQTNSKGIIMTTDNMGHLRYISSSGKIQETNFGEFSEDHYFLYSDFDGNGHNDFIFLDQKTLMVFDRFKNVVFRYDFKEAVMDKPEIISASDREKLLGVVVAPTRQVFLFDQKGNMLVSTGLIGQTPFTVGSLEMDGKMNLIIGSEEFLYNYDLK